jgi:hypothetical protein
MCKVRRNALTAADGDDNFKFVGIQQEDIRVLASRDDLAIAFHRNALARKIKFEQKFGNAQGSGELVLLAVNTEGDHFVAPKKSSRILVREFTTRV